jgi:hypothetical protein
MEGEDIEEDAVQRGREERRGRRRGKGMGGMEGRKTKEEWEEGCKRKERIGFIVCSDSFETFYTFVLECIPSEYILSIKTQTS